MSKRKRDGSAQVAGGSKHARVREGQREREPESVPRRRKLKGVRLPVDIAALAHVLQQLEDLLLSPDEAMLEAAAFGHVTWVQELLGSFECELLEPLHVAAANGHAEVLEALLDKLVKPPSELDSGTSDALQYALMAAGEHEHLAVLQLLVTCFLAAGSTHKREHAASTVTLVLEDAAAHGQLAVVDFLVTHAAPLFMEFVDPSEESPALAAAIMGWHVDVAWYLLDRDADGVIFDFVTAFWVALDAGLNDLADRIDVYSLRRHERTALLLELAVDDSVDAVKYIIDKGVDLDLVSKAFKKAAKAGAVAVVQFL
ncbi:hypothetical protein PHYSODRAFT_256456 [Phytophthora sojae]|uniref:Uncharacterized protein n=1 Tax=Phytophthora sojae (strain P6497) TaxID=1094619 RepID=G4ZGD5_PHYSP|nr:hypothetical protein PHYSODRAFT_256456 [Phytophthora sojae]EGZ18580.1 hypothetical protein PHYSODRAFT_256456 [Phytophthora sojae]|eukprot:XP_009527638.1 hypothetical protein PHYSODRAFT_256456 [Phytophthora sojae]